MYKENWFVVVLSDVAYLVVVEGNNLKSQKHVYKFKYLRQLDF